MFVRTVEQPSGDIQLVNCIDIRWDHLLPQLKFGNQNEWKLLDMMIQREREVLRMKPCIIFSFKEKKRGFSGKKKKEGMVKDLKR